MIFFYSITQPFKTRFQVQKAWQNPLLKKAWQNPG
uniref:Uncharacterized protein n=1 Tax=viral metagenome TaxID=1070528 RepID=A0A6C0HH99_9ZZZZ